MTKKSGLRAWVVYVPSWQLQPMSLTMATTRGKAIAKNYSSATEAGYALKWGEFRAVRAPKFDRATAKYGEFSWDYSHAVRILSDGLPMGAA